jgi:hypothetical protein
VGTTSGSSSTCRRSPHQRLLRFPWPAGALPVASRRYSSPYPISRWLARASGDRRRRRGWGLEPPTRPPVELRKMMADGGAPATSLTGGLRRARRSSCSSSHGPHGHCSGRCAGSAPWLGDGELRAAAPLGNRRSIQIEPSQRGRGRRRGGPHRRSTRAALTVDIEGEGAGTGGGLEARRPTAPLQAVAPWGWR